MFIRVGSVQVWRFLSCITATSSIWIWLGVGFIWLVRAWNLGVSLVCVGRTFWIRVVWLVSSSSYGSSLRSNNIWQLPCLEGIVTLDCLSSRVWVVVTPMRLRVWSSLFLPLSLGDILMSPLFTRIFFCSVGSHEVSLFEDSHFPTSFDSFITSLHDLRFVYLWIELSLFPPPKVVPSSINSRYAPL